MAKFMRRTGSVLVSFFIILSAYANGVERVSVSTNGEQANGSSQGNQSLSADGRFVAYSSDASNLVEGDTNDQPDIFVYDRETDITERVSVSATTEQGNGYSINPSISADGRYIAFESYASNLVDRDNKANADIFVHDRETRVTELISVSLSGISGNSHSYEPSISADGRYVAFNSRANNLVENDSNDARDIFRRDRKAGITELVSVTSTGELGNKYSLQPNISADGRYIAFTSHATNLVDGDTNGKSDIFRRDIEAGVTIRVSVSSNGIQSRSFSGEPFSSVNASISADGRFVAFGSNANNLGFFSNYNIGSSYSNSNYRHIYVHDTATGVTESVSVYSRGGDGPGNSFRPSISADGRFVTFSSSVSTLVDDDTNRDADVFVHDRTANLTERVSVSSTGQQAVDASLFSAISADGNFVSYVSVADNLIDDDTNTVADVFVSERSPSNIYNKLTAVVRPTSGASIVREYVRFRAFLTNTTNQTLTNCRVEMTRNVNPQRPRLFKFYTWPLGVINPQVNLPVDIEPGQTARMNLAVFARQNYRGEVKFVYTCNDALLHTTPFVNTIHLIAKYEPLIAEDFVQLDANGRSEVVIDRANNFKYWYSYIVNVKNTGSEATRVNLIATSDLIETGQLRQPQFCEQGDPNNTAVCAAPRSEQLTVELGADETKKIRVFAHANSQIEDIPNASRIYVEAHDSAGEIVSKTSIGIHTIN